MAIILSFSLLYHLIMFVWMMCEMFVGLNVEERLHGGWMDAVMTGRRRLNRLRERLLAPGVWIPFAWPPKTGGPFPFLGTDFVLDRCGWPANHAVGRVVVTCKWWC